MKSNRKKEKHIKTDKSTQVESDNDLALLTDNLEENIEIIKKSTGESSDIVIRKIRVGKDGGINIGVLYTDGLVNIDLVQDFILKTLMLEIRKVPLDTMVSPSNEVLDLLMGFSLPNGEVEEVENFDSLFTKLLSGDTIILIDGYEKGILIDTKGWEDRGVTEPNTQTVVRGPKDSFTETIQTNTALIRRRIRDPNLWIETTQIGRRTKTDVAIAYINGIADDKTVDEVRQRLANIDIDGILESGYIEELIQDEVYTPFPTVYNSERPDAISGGLLEGRIAILVDGTPFVLLVPALFVHFLQSPEDYYQRFDISTLIRLLRYLSFFVALLTPALYIALTTFHHEMLPTTLLVSIAAQREGIPFPALVEALMMEFTFEILREAGIRLPKAVGATISIVGALVLGEAAVQAGIVSPVMVIVVSITAISSFVFPTYNMGIAVRICRFAFMLLGASFGLFGISLGLFAMILHLCSLRSFGVPYMAPMAPFVWSDQKDTIFRFPRFTMFFRPHLISQKTNIRQQSPTNAKPAPKKRK